MLTRPADSPSSLLKGLAPHLGAAYLLACRVLGSNALAEDAVQEALLGCTRHPPRSIESRALAAYFMRAVHGAAVNLARSETARRSREEKAAMQASVSSVRPDAAAVLNETALAARRELDLLAPDLRTAICLCCEQGFTQNEAAEILEVPLGTVARRVQRGLEELRERLTRSGYAAPIPAALAGMLGELGIPPAPASLGAAFEKIASGSGAAGIGGSGAVVAIVAKGGLIVKIGLGIAAAGALAGTIAVVNTVGAQHAAPLQASPPATPAAAPEKKSKFDTPIWHPDARWEKAGDWAGLGIAGNLDGPRQEVMWRWAGTPPYFQQTGWPYVIWGYDNRTERIHAVACSGRGFLDGPFSRARFEGPGYFSGTGMIGSSPDRRFLLMKDQGAVRALDFKDQMVRTILPPGSDLMSAKVDSTGNVVALLGNGAKCRLVTIDSATGKATGEIAMNKATDGVKGMAGFALDEKHNRLYACGTPFEKDGKLWHVWYFDLADGGSFHGVLAGERIGPNGGYAGPFDGFKGYGDKGIYFGPDDPDYRFLYMPATDTGTFMRLDLEKRLVAAFSGPPKGQAGPAMFIESGTPNPMVAHVGPRWLPTGDFVLPGLRSGPALFFRRVK